MAKPPSWRWLLATAPLLLHPLADASRGRHIALRPALAAACTPHDGCEKREKHFWQALRGCQGYTSLPPRIEAEEEDELGGENVGREQKDGLDGENSSLNRAHDVVVEDGLDGIDKERVDVEREQEVVVEDWLDGARFLSANVRREQEGAVEVDWLKLTDRELQMQCRVETLRSSGPGGQHRNKTESAVRLLHLPTGLVAFAAEDRSQHKNRTKAFKRLREVIALEVRRPVELEGYRAPPELMRILPKASKKREGGQKIGPNHDDFVQGVQPLLDLLGATKGSISECAAILGLSTGALSRLLVSNRVLWKGVNNLRATYNLKPIRGD